MRNSNVDSILFIRSAEREHSGKYELVLKIENMEDRATIEIRVIGKIRLKTSEALLVTERVSQEYAKNTLIPCRKTWTSPKSKGDRRVGLQRSTGVGPSH